MLPEKEQTGIPTVAERKQQVDNVFPSSSNLESVIAEHIAHTSKKIFGKEISTISTVVAEYLDDIRPSTYEDTYTGVHSLLFSFVEQVLLDLPHQDMSGQTLSTHMAPYFDSNDSADEVCRKILSINSFMATISAFIQCRACESMAA